MSQATSTETSLRPRDGNGPSLDSTVVAAAGDTLPTPGQAPPSDAANASDIRKSALLDLAYEDYMQRLEAGEQVDPDEFCTRYPALQSSLRSLLRAHSYMQGVPDLVEQFQKQQWPAVGTTFLGFRLQRDLGHGAFARVYLADEPALGNRRVAVKVSCHGKSEARTLGQLAHANIVPVHSIKEDAESDLTAVCMPYLGNATLSDVLDYAFTPTRQRTEAAVLLDAVAAVTFADDPVPARRAPAAVLRHGTYAEGVAYFGFRLAQALAFVHRLNICHGDLKPSNVLLSPEGEPLLLDFNLALAEQVAGSRVGGTLPYMSPEQLRATDPARGIDLAGVDARSDLFSLGVMLYELLSGKHPFGPVPLKMSAGELRTYLLERQQQGPTSLQHACPGIDRDLARVIERCLAQDPAQRPQSAAELDAELRHFLAPVPRLRRRAAPYKKVILAGTCAVLALAAVAAYNLAPSGSLSEQRFQAGNKSFRTADYRTAIEHYTSALLVDAKYAPARLARARAYLNAGLTSEAITDFKLLSSDAGDKDGRLLAGVGYAYLKKGESFNAVEPLRAAIRNGYATAPVLNDLAFCLLQGGHPEKGHKVEAAIPEALQLLEQAVKLDPNLQAAYANRAWASLTQSFMNAKLVPTAGIEAVETALKIGPETHDLHEMAALLYAQAATVNEKMWLEPAYVHLQAALAQGADPARLALGAGFEGVKDSKRFRMLVAQPRQPEQGPLSLYVNPLTDDPER
jgi:serine/threonine protein kinase/Flp pilus assembly protein TadD